MDRIGAGDRLRCRLVRRDDRYIGGLAVYSLEAVVDLALRGGAAVQQYKLEFLDEAGELIGQPEFFTAYNDEAAIAKANLRIIPADAVLRQISILIADRPIDLRNVSEQH